MAEDVCGDGEESLLEDLGDVPAAALALAFDLAVGGSAVGLAAAALGAAGMRPEGLGQGLQRFGVGLERLCLVDHPQTAREHLADGAVDVMADLGGSLIDQVAEELV